MKKKDSEPERDVLRRMLSTPPAPHKSPKAKKPKAPKKKPA
jgi:hypothetical protein